MILLHTAIHFDFDFQGQKQFFLCRFYGIHVALIIFFFFSFSFLCCVLNHSKLSTKYRFGSTKCLSKLGGDVVLMRLDFSLNFPRLVKLLSDKSISLHVLDIVRNTYKNKRRMMSKHNFFNNEGFLAQNVRGTSMHNFDHF
jgi:hypothetical protein